MCVSQLFGPSSPDLDKLRQRLGLLFVVGRMLFVVVVVVCV